MTSRRQVGRLLAGVLVTAAVSCGDAGTGTGPSLDQTPPTVLSTDPANGADGLRFEYTKLPPRT